jgi:hypothetical protein
MQQQAGVCLKRQWLPAFFFFLGVQFRNDNVTRVTITAGKTQLARVNDVSDEATKTLW